MSDLLTFINILTQLDFIHHLIILLEAHYLNFIYVSGNTDFNLKMEHVCNLKFRKSV